MVNTTNPFNNGCDWKLWIESRNWRGRIDISADRNINILTIEFDESFKCSITVNKRLIDSFLENPKIDDIFNCLLSHASLKEQKEYKTIIEKIEKEREDRRIMRLKREEKQKKEEDEAKKAISNCKNIEDKKKLFVSSLSSNRYIIEFLQDEILDVYEPHWVFALTLEGQEFIMCHWHETIHIYNMQLEELFKTYSR